jgi:hypothetical protein
VQWGPWVRRPDADVASSRIAVNARRLISETWRLRVAEEPRENADRITDIERSIVVDIADRSAGDLWDCALTLALPT